jgi:hypothetical protein
MKKLLIAITLLQFGFVNAQIENGMIAHFPFNNNISDISTSAINAVNNAGVFGLDRNNVANHAIEFNDIGYVSFNDPILKQQFPVSVSYWIKFNSTSQVQFPFKTDNVFNDYNGVWMNSLPSGGLTLSFGGGLGSANSTNQRYFTTDATALTAGNWYHVVGIIRDFDDMDIYIDCVEATGVYGGTGPTSVAYSSNGDSRIGGSIGSAVSPADNNLDGSIDQFVFWNREITLAEITFMCDTNNPLALDELDETPKELVKIVDFMGRECEATKNTPLIYIYSDGSTKRVVQVD